MVSLCIALQFLTIIPIKIKQFDERKIAYSVMFFPVVGLLLGLILSGVILVLFRLGMQDLSISIFAVVLLIILTGGLHLDGLADTADALLSHKNKDEMLRIMRDSHIGVMGVLSIACTLLLKIALISSMFFSAKIFSVILMCVLSRWAIVLVMYAFPYARQEGKAKLFVKGTSLKMLVLSTLTTLVLVVAISKLKGLILMAMIAISAYAMGNFARKKINGITGDTIGAISELAEVLVLFIILVMERIGL